MAVTYVFLNSLMAILCLFATLMTAIFAGLQAFGSPISCDDFPLCPWGRVPAGLVISENSGLMQS